MKLAEIEQLVEERGKQYGSPHENHARTAKLWNAYLACRENKPLTPVDICFLNILQKVSRSMSKAGVTDDTIADIAGFAQNIGLLLQNDEQPNVGTH